MRKAQGDLACVAIVSVEFCVFFFCCVNARKSKSLLFPPPHSVSFALVLVCARSKSEKRRLATEAKRDRDMLILGQSDGWNAGIRSSKPLTSECSVLSTALIR